MGQLFGRGLLEVHCQINLYVGYKSFEFAEEDVKGRFSEDGMRGCQMCDTQRRPDTYDADYDLSYS